MFTGLVRHLGSLAARQPRSGGQRMRIAAPEAVIAGAEQGASICVNGACLTAVSRDAGHFEADLSEETLQKTTFAALPLGAVLHLEPSLRVGDPMDGHLVSGHVDGVGRLLERAEGEGLWRFAMPRELAPLVAPKGSIAVDGLSLTVVDCGSDWFTVALIPETVRATRLKTMAMGESVNLEGDPVGRFVARALALRGQEDRLGAFARRGWEG